MDRAGIFGHEERFELIDGVLYEMPTVGDEHAGDVNSLNYHLSLRLMGRALISVQNPMRLTDDSMPEPDLLVLKIRPDFYRTGKAQPEDVLLLVEVSFSSLGYDRQFKLLRYARSGISEVWIVNLVAQLVEVYRDPAGEGYRTSTEHRRGDTLSLLAFPDVTITVEEILGQ